MGHRIRYLGRQLPAHDFDGWAASLRLVTDGQYVQYFRAIAPAAQLLQLEPKPGPDWWTEFIQAAAREIQALVESGGFQAQPHGTPIFLHPDVAAVHEASRRPDPGRRHLTANEPSIEGVEVLRFGEGEIVAERRRSPR
jgi:hypothetical protein